MCKTASTYPGQPAYAGNANFPDFSKTRLIRQTSNRMRKYSEVFWAIKVVLWNTSCGIILIGQVSFN